MSGKKLCSVYSRIAPVAAKISLVGLIVSVVCMVISAFYKNTLTEPWPIYYAAVAELIWTWAAIAFAALYVLSDFRQLWPKLKESVRKSIVSLKRNPSMIPLVVLFFTFLMYSFNLTDMSDTTAKIQGKGMGLSQFCIMLFSLLSLVCMLNSFPRRKKPNIPMIVLMYVMFAIIIYCDIHYRAGITAALYRAESPIVLDTNTLYIAKAYNMLNTHMILVGVTAALVALLPVYGKLLKKINTSIVIEDNGDMEQIELND